MILLMLLGNYVPGDKVNVIVKRGKEELTFEIELGSRIEFKKMTFLNKMSSLIFNNNVVTKRNNIKIPQ